MHIHFNLIRWKNLLSTGNTWTQIKLDEHPLTLMIGKNGAGKSTLLDALCFALFNKPFRDINKPQLVNSINNKHCMVEVNFTVGDVEYLIRRGLKPAVFEIYKDGNLLNQDADSRDYQSVLENEILKIGYKAFTQVIILGATDYVPFMKLTAANRRDIIESLLGIQIFSEMNVYLKELITTNRTELEDVTFQRRLIEEKIKLQKNNIDQQKMNMNHQIDMLELEVENLASENIHIQVKVDECTERLKEKIQVTKDLRKENFRLDGLRLTARNLTEDTKSILKDVKFYEQHQNCPVCKQTIEESFRANQIGEKNKQVQKNVSIYDSTNEQIQTANNTIGEMQTKLTALQLVSQDLQTHQNKINANQMQIDRLNKQIQSQKNIKDIGSENETLTNLELELSDTNDTYKELLEQKKLYELASPILKDNGIKSKIIKLYIPVINKLINKYLAEMDFFVNFELDETFKETIRSRHRDVFSYGSFSEGEKMRIDLALLFTWRAIAKMRSRTSSNLLIMDELFDSSMDSDGIDGFTKILNDLTSENNVILISHKTDVMLEKFPVTLMFDKVKNFSKVSQYA